MGSLARSYAARVRQMSPSPEKTSFGASPPFSSPEDGSFRDRERLGSFDRRRQSFARASSDENRPAPRLSSPPFLRASSEFITTGFPPAAGSRRRLPTLRTKEPHGTTAPRGRRGLSTSDLYAPQWDPLAWLQEVDESASQTSWLPDALPPAPASSRRFHVRGGGMHHLRNPSPSGDMLTEVFCYNSADYEGVS